MSWKKLSAIIMATSLLAGGEAFAKKRHNHDHEHAKKRPTIQRKKAPVPDEKYEYKVTKLPNGRIKINHYYKTLEKDPHEEKFITIHDPKTALDVIAKAKARATKALNDKKSRDAKALAQARATKEKSKGHQKKTVAKKKVAEKKQELRKKTVDQKKRIIATKKKVVAKKKKDIERNKKVVARRTRPTRSFTRNAPSNNLSNHVWEIKDLGNGTVLLSHRKDQEVMHNGTLLKAKIPGKPTHYIINKKDLPAELKRQQDEAKKEPKAAPIRNRTTKSSLLDNFFGRKKEKVVARNPKAVPEKKKEKPSLLRRLFGKKKKNKK